jgi:hypothetical protein
MTIPLWLHVSLWIIWSAWAVYEVYCFATYLVHNAKYYNRAYYTDGGKRVTSAFLGLSIFWLSWNILG